jgi:hypothetical protein
LRGRRNRDWLTGKLAGCGWLERQQLGARAWNYREPFHRRNPDAGVLAEGWKSLMSLNNPTCFPDMLKFSRFDRRVIFLLVILSAVMGVLLWSNGRAVMAAPDLDLPEMGRSAHLVH